MHYYAQNNVSSAVTKAMQLAKKQHTADAVGNCYDTIIVMGYSNGGRAAIQFSERLNAENIKIAVAVTADPIPKGLELVPPLSFFPGSFLTRPDNVEYWVNYYQQIDKKSLAGLPVHGHSIVGANFNQRFYSFPDRYLGFNENDYAHIYIMEDQRVLAGVESLLQNSDESQSTWKSH